MSGGAWMLKTSELQEPLERLGPRRGLLKADLGIAE